MDGEETHVPIASVVNQLQDVGLNDQPRTSTPLGSAAVPNLSSSPSGSLASGSSLSHLSARSDLGGAPSLSSINALQTSLQTSLCSGLSDSGSILPTGPSYIISSRVPAPSAPVGILPPDAHASIPGSLHSSLPTSGTASPQRFAGNLGTASVPPTLPPAGQSAFACFSGGTMGGPPQGLGSTFNQPIQRFGINSGKSSSSLSSAFGGYNAFTSSAIPTQPRPMPEDSLPQQQQPQQLQHSGHQHNPIHLYNMQQPSMGFYSSNYHTLDSPATQSPPQNGMSGTVSPAWPLQETRLNLNKAITKRLTSATHFQQLLEIIAESSAYFDEVQAATSNLV
jgi:hypothetical protein